MTGREALAEAAAAERARAARPCRGHHHHTNSGTGPGDPAAIAELIDAVLGPPPRAPGIPTPWAGLTPGERTRAVRDLRRSGYSWRAVARHYGIDPKTVRRWAARASTPNSQKEN